MTLRGVAKFFLGVGSSWEYKLVALRIAVIAAVTLGAYLLINSGFKRYASLAFWLFVVGVAASIVYQYRRRAVDAERERNRPNRR